MCLFCVVCCNFTFCIFLLKTNYSQIITSVFVYFYRFPFVNKTSCLCFVSFFSRFFVFSFLSREASVSLFVFISSKKMFLSTVFCFRVCFHALPAAVSLS